MDALSDLLRTVKLNGALFLEARFSAPWCADVHPTYGAAEALAPYNPVVFFHILAEGRCRVRLVEGSEPIELSAGDLIMLPRGDTHLLGSDLQLAPVDAGALMRPPALGGMATIEHGGGGATAAPPFGDERVSAGHGAPRSRVLSASSRIFRSAASRSRSDCLVRSKPSRLSVRTGTPSRSTIVSNCLRLSNVSPHVRNTRSTTISSASRMPSPSSNRRQQLFR